jgi:hypothetical protein
VAIDLATGEEAWSVRMVGPLAVSSRGVLSIVGNSLTPDGRTRVVTFNLPAR